MNDTVVIIPTYNESENLRELLPKLKQYDVDVLVVDDSPDDTTANTAVELGVSVIHRRHKKGLSSAVIDGIEYTKHRDVIVMDGDLQHPPEAVPRLLGALKTHDFAIMSRYVEGGGCRNWDFDRKVISRGANLVARPLYLEGRDLVSGFFGFHREGLPELNGVNTKGFKIMLELLVRGHWKRLVELPYTFEDRIQGESKLSTGKIIDYLTQLMSLYLHKFRWIKFGMVGAVGTVVGLGSLYLLTEFVGLHYLVSYVIALFLSVTNNYILNSLWTFGRSMKAIGWTKYATISAFTLAFNMGLISFLTEVMGLWYMTSAVCGVFAAFVLNYVFSRRFVWKSLDA